MNWTLVLALVLMVTGMIAYSRGSYRFGEPAGMVMGWIGGVYLVLGGIFMICSYTVSVSSNAEMIAFHDHTLSAYKYTYAQTEAMDVGTETNSPNVIVETEHMNQAGAASERLKELRNKVAWYNKKLQQKRDYNNHWFLRLWITDPPEGIGFITLK